MTRRDRLLPRRGGNFPETVVLFRVCSHVSLHISHARLKNIPGSRPTTQPRVHVSARGRHRSVLSPGSLRPARSLRSSYLRTRVAGSLRAAGGGGLDDLQQRGPDDDEDEEAQHHGADGESVLALLLGVDVHHPALVDVLAVAIVAGAHDALGDGLSGRGSAG